MTFLAAEMAVWLVVSALGGAVLLWLGQWAWGRLRAPMKWRVLELELEEVQREREHFNERLAATQRQFEEAERSAERQRRARRQLTATLDARNRAFQVLEAEVASSERKLRVAETAPPGTPAQSGVHAMPPAEDSHAKKELARVQQELKHALITQERLRAETEVLKDIASHAESEIEGLRARLLHAETDAMSARESRPPAWVMARPLGNKDNLQELEGVDGELEASLNRLGIYHYHQIARFEATDVDWVVEQIGSVPVGVVQDSWIPTATELSGLRA